MSDAARLFCFHCRDGEYGAELRQRHRATHLDYVSSHGHNYAVAGPLKRDGVMIGSLLIIKGTDEQDARTKLEADPYFVAGVWQAIRVDEFEPLNGDWAKL